MFHLKLKELREKQKLSQNEIAVRIGVAASSYSSYELGRQLPKIDTLKKICEEFSVSADWLLDNSSNAIGDAADILDSVINLKSAGAAVQVINVSYIDFPMPEDLACKPTIAIFIDGVDLAPIIENIDNFNTLIRKGTITESVMVTWLEAEKSKLKNNSDLIPNKYSSDLAHMIQYRIEQEPFDMTPPDYDPLLGIN